MKRFNSATIIIFFSILFFIANNLSASLLEQFGQTNNFNFEISVSDSDQQIIINADTSPSTYLYKHGFKFSTNDATLGQITYPKGINKYDPELGNYTIFRNNFQIKIAVSDIKNNPVKFKLEYQGCSDQGVCFAPEYKNFDLKFNKINQNINTNINVNHSIDTVLKILGFFVLGILLSFTPCVLPIIPILSKIIVGQKKVSTYKSFLLSFSYVQGMSIAYAISGVLIALGGANLSAELQRPSILIITSIIFVILAFSMFGAFQLKLPESFENKIDTFRKKQQHGSIIGTFLMGFISSLILSPCISAPIAGALIYIAQTGNTLIGGLSLYTLGLGMGIPLILLGTSFGKLLPKSGPWMETIKNILGILLLAVAISLLDRVLPGPIILAISGVTLIFIAIYAGLFDKNNTKFTHFKKSLGALLLIYGTILIIGATLNGNQILHPFNNAYLLHASTCNNKNYQKFIVFKNYTNLKNAIASAPKNKLVIVDVYANWCVSCKIMERDVFHNPIVQEKLKNALLLKADLSNFNQDAKNILHELKVFNPPNVIFFKNNQEIDNTRINHQVNADEFLIYLKKAQGTK